MNGFPYSGRTPLGPSSDPAILELQKAILQMQDLLLGIASPDPGLKVIAHFDNDLSNMLGNPGSSTGALRYWKGKFDSGVLVEGSGTNIITNPSAELDTVGWSPVDTCVSLSRSGNVSYTQNATMSAGSFKVAGTGDAGRSMIKTTATVVSNTAYSASVYVYAPPDSMGTKANFELGFLGGTPVTASTDSMSIPAGTWTRLRVENVNSGNNVTCEVRVYLTQTAPAFAPGTRLSTLAPSSSASVVDSGMTITTGDLCMAALTSQGSGRNAYAWHMVTQGATGVSSTDLRLDDASQGPVFVGGTRFSRLAPSSGDSVGIGDTGLVLNGGDLVFCDLGSGYDWHLVTTGATGVANTALRLDDAPSAPRFTSGSRLTRFVPSASAAVTDGSLVLSVGDLVFARMADAPYGWHVVTQSATGVGSPNLALDGAMKSPFFATGSILSKMAPLATGSASDTTAVLSLGDFAFASPTKNPSATGHGRHMVTASATGVSSPSLGLDQATSEVIHVDCVQLEKGATSSSYIDSYQGSGFSGAVGSPSSRTSTTLSFSADGVVSPSSGTVAFWMYPLWSGTDNQEHVLFDMAVGSGQNRLRLAKDVANKLVLSVYDSTGGLKQLVTDGAVGFQRETWQHLAFTWNTGTLQMFLNGVTQTATSSGSGTGQLNKVGASLYLGSDYKGFLTQGTLFEDLVVSASVMKRDAINQIYLDTGKFMGLAAARRGFNIGQGNSTTPGTSGTQMSVSHSLGVTPQFVVLTPRGSGSVYLSAPADATSFYVTASSPSVSFDWRAYA